MGASEVRSCLCPFNETVYTDLEIERLTEESLSGKAVLAVRYAPGTDPVALRQQVYLHRTQQRRLRDPSDFIDSVLTQMRLFHAELELMIVDSAQMSTELRKERALQDFISEWDIHTQKNSQLNLTPMLFHRWTKCFQSEVVQTALYTRVICSDLSLSFLGYLITSEFGARFFGKDQGEWEPNYVDLEWYLALIDAGKEYANGRNFESISFLEIPLFNPNKPLRTISRDSDWDYHLRNWPMLSFVFVVSLMGYRRPSQLNGDSSDQHCQLKDDISRIQELAKEHNYVILTDRESFSLAIRDYPIDQINGQFSQHFRGNNPRDLEESLSFIKSLFEGDDLIAEFRRFYFVC